MAVYGALVPLKIKIRGYLKYYDASFDPLALELAKYLYKEVKSFQEFVERLDSSSRKGMNASLARITDAVPKFHDLLSLHLAYQYAKVDDQRNRTLLRLGLHEEEQEENQMLSLIDMLEDIQGDKDRENQLLLPEEEEEERNSMSHLINLRDIERDIHSFIEALKKVQVEESSSSSSRIDELHGKESMMVGLSDLYTELKEDMVTRWSEAVKVFAIVGMAGIGKTTLAKEIFEDLDIVEWFECRAWVEVGREWRLAEIIRGIVAQVKPDEMVSTEEEDDDDEKISNCLKECLKGKRYLIVLDDVWDGQLIVAYYPDRIPLTCGCWDLLREKVFDGEPCSFQLERAGRRIAEKCDGLPLTILAVADLLSEAEKTLEYWKKVATQEKHQLFVEAYEQVSKVLHPSYENLPQHLKMCLLYMGVFPQNHNVPTSKIINMWIAEGLILEQNTTKSSKKLAVKCLDELAANSVVVYQKSTKSSSNMSISDEEIKACGLHSSWWHLCYKEATKINFFHVLNSREDSLVKRMKGQSRLSIHNNILLAIKEVYESMEDHCASSARSLLFYGPYSRYPIPVCSAFKLLEVLDALKIRFYGFPSQVLELVELKYLALTYDGKLPPSISKLRKLQFLIVCPHQNIGALVYLPREIWDIKELKHLQVLGIHNVRKLGIRIELPPDHCGEPLSCFDHISDLKKLKSLKCVVVNPELRPELVPPPTLAAFTLHLKKLALSGMGYPWAEMSNIAALENLQVLKLRCNAFQGPKWEIEENTFPALEYLLIEDSDLEQWKVGCGNFKWLDHLSIQHCYKLQELDWEFDECISRIEVVDCDPTVEKQIKETMWGKGIPALDFYVHYSWNDGKLKL
ncbi:hypothetical protein C2S51_003214 [Perilla frutescens var. frutescens]|nr:hypothetical protein C2S51_003214 [Perilla frutescens var. frutescens]